MPAPVRSPSIARRKLLAWRRGRITDTTDRATSIDWPWRLGGIAATVLAGALLALVVAYWGWRWFGPATPIATVDGAEPRPMAIVTAAPFGRVRAAPPFAPAGAAPPANAALGGDVRLLGVFAGSDGSGYALFRLPDRGAVLVKRGDEIASGLRLDAVYPQAVRLAGRGETRDIELRPANAASAPPTPAPARVATAAPRAVRPACAAPPGFSGPTYRLNAELLTGMGARPESWNAALAPAQGGLTVRDETGLAAMLGMKPGDRITQANGIALGSIDDVLTAVVKPLVASQPVRVAGTRDGQPREWLFVNASACAS
jgi:hypothetical protein